MMQRKRSIIFDLKVQILVPRLERRRYQEATVSSRMHRDKSVDQCIRLLYQPNAQYQIHANCKGMFRQKYTILREYDVLILKPAITGEIVFTKFLSL